MDNCVRENKNRFVFTYLSWLIYSGVFKEIYVNFLPVGHTHNDNDQLSSRVAVACRHRDIKSIPEFFSRIETSSIPKPKAEIVKRKLGLGGDYNKARKITGKREKL